MQVIWKEHGYVLAADELGTLDASEELRPVVEPSRNKCSRYNY